MTPGLRAGPKLAVLLARIRPAGRPVARQVVDRHPWAGLAEPLAKRPVGVVPGPSAPLGAEPVVEVANSPLRAGPARRPGPRRRPDRPSGAGPQAEPFVAAALPLVEAVAEAGERRGAERQAPPPVGAVAEVGELTLRRKLRCVYKW